MNFIYFDSKFAFSGNPNYSWSYARAYCTCQKSPQVFSNGPWAAMYLLTTPLEGTLICEKVSKLLLRATRGARTPIPQVVIMHASHVCSQDSFGLPLRMNGMQRSEFDHSRMDLLSFAIWWRVFWPSITWKLRKAQRQSKSGLTFGRCGPHSVTLVITSW